MSGRADFYVLAAGDERYHFACRLIEKAYKLGNRVWLRLDEPSLEALDELLWTFKPEAFVPHQIFQPGAHLNDCPVWLMSQLPAGSCDLLVNLASSIWEPLPSVTRVAELVTQEAPILQVTRQQYALYKALNWSITTHKL